mgnify:CR=1 FL=1
MKEEIKRNRERNEEGKNKKKGGEKENKLKNIWEVRKGEWQ